MVIRKYIVLVFYDEGLCSDFFFVIVKYYVCLELIYVGGLVILLRIMVLVNDLELVVGGCVLNVVLE